MGEKRSDGRIYCTRVGGVDAASCKKPPAKEYSQDDFVASDWLPRDDSKPEKQAILESFGVEILGPVEGEEDFCHARLPDGWKKVATNHPFYSDLIDDKGRVRASMFYLETDNGRAGVLMLC